MPKQKKLRKSLGVKKRPKKSKRKREAIKAERTSLLKKIQSKHGGFKNCPDDDPDLERYREIAGGKK